LSPDRRPILYGSLALNLLQLYFLTGALANYPGLVAVNAAILVAFVFVA